MYLFVYFVKEGRFWRTAKNNTVPNFLPLDLRMRAGVCDQHCLQRRSKPTAVTLYQDLFSQVKGLKPVVPVNRLIDDENQITAQPV